MRTGLIPLIKVIKAAIVDTHEDLSIVQQMYSHWAGRGLKKLNRQSLRTGKRKALLQVNKNTNTATLPFDFGEETFVGVLDGNGYKIPLRINSQITDTQNISSAPPNPCTACGQDKNICKDIEISEESSIVVIDGVAYDETVVKKMYPNGDYFLIKKSPVPDIDSGEVTYVDTKELITHFEKKECGCLESTSETLNLLRTHCPDAYACYYAPCASISEVGSYRIFEESNLIQLSPRLRHSNIYIEYSSDIPKINGQYVVPEVAFEALVEYTKFKAIEGKKNVSNADRQFRWNMYTMERGNMEKELGRVDLNMILDAARGVPKLITENRGLTITAPRGVGYIEPVCSTQPTNTPSSTTIINSALGNLIEDNWD